MIPMSPTQIKTFDRLSSLVLLAETTTRATVAVAAMFAETMRSGTETPAKLQSVLGYLEHDLDSSVESMLDATTSLANLRRLFGLPPAIAFAEVARTPAGDANEVPGTIYADLEAMPRDRANRP